MTLPDDHTHDDDGPLDATQQPGPRDEGGSGGMASREQEAREETETSANGE